MRKSTLIVCVLTGLIGFGLFQLKYEMMTLETTYRRLNQDIKLSEESISILKAEWAHLTNPSTLQAMARKHLTIEAVTPKQLVSFKHDAKGKHQSQDQKQKNSPPPSSQSLDSELDVILNEALNEIAYTAPETPPDTASDTASDTVSERGRR
jgi:hypothetical protein